VLAIQRGLERPRTRRRLALLVAASVALGVAVAVGVLALRHPATNPDGKVVVAVADAYQGRVREALRAASASAALTDDASRAWLAGIRLVGRPRLQAPEALEVARRIPNPQFRRNWLTWLGAFEEAEQITVSLEGKGYRMTEAINTSLVLAHRGKHAEAADMIASVREDLHRRNIVRWAFAQASFHAEQLLAAGKAFEASRIWPATAPCRCTDPLDRAAYYPSLALVRARALQQLGRRADAIRELDGVVAFWKEADPDLPLLVEAKAMRRRLAVVP
jgi:tetratricopeptide (TPR) repeat protein